jgi:hypothetical protein
MVDADRDRLAGSRPGAPVTPGSAYALLTISSTKSLASLEARDISSA